MFAAASGLGHLNSPPDVDGNIRTEPLMLRYYDRGVPSLSAMLAAKSLNLDVKDIKVTPGEGVQLGKLRIRTAPDLRMYTFFYNDREGRSAFSIDSFFDVYSGKIPADKYRDKIVLIGATAAGLGNPQVTPISPAMPPVVTLAHSVSSILQEHFFIEPTWGVWVKLAAILLVAAYLIALLPRLKAGPGAAVTAGLFVAFLVAHFALSRSSCTAPRPRSTSSAPMSLTGRSGRISPRSRAATSRSCAFSRSWSVGPCRSASGASPRCRRITWCLRSATISKGRTGASSSPATRPPTTRSGVHDHQP